MSDPHADPPGPGAAAAAELVEVVDERGVVRRTATRAEVRAGNLRHRSVFVAVVTGSGEVVVHQRAAWKDVWPSVWDVAFGGVVGVGESFADAARRELAEEAGIVDVHLERVGGGTYADDAVAEVAEVYLARHDGPLATPDGEVARLDRVPIDGLGAWCAERSVCPDSLALVVPVLTGGAGRSAPG